MNLRDNFLTRHRDFGLFWGAMLMVNIGVQIEAVTIIARLTFDEVGGVKKTVAALKEMVQAEGGLASLTGGQG